MSTVSAQQTSDRNGPGRAAAHGWPQALAAVAAALAVMAVTAALGLWAAGAADLPDGAFWRVVAAVVLMAVGGSVSLSGDASALVGTEADLSALPLSVTLAGALTVAAGFLRPLRHRAVAGVGELTAWAARAALLWAAALIALCAAARHTFEIPVDDPTGGLITDVLGVPSPSIGFRADYAPSLLFGLLWLAGVFTLALLVSRGAPLPARLLRFQESVRPAAYAMVALLLAYVALGLVVGLVVAATRGHAAQTFAVVLLGLPNLVWLSLTLGVGASWEGRVEGPFGLPMPRVLDQVLRGPDDSTLNLRTLSAYDGRVWWLAVVAAVLLLAAAWVMAVRSPARVRLWQHAAHFAAALALTVLAVCLVAETTAHVGLSLLGIGDLGGALSAEVVLRPDLWTAVGIAAGWGLLAGFVGGLLALPVHRRGEVRPAAAPPSD
ncbi:streptophobe family protein [Streptomyces sp. O3]